MGSDGRGGVTAAADGGGAPFERLFAQGRDWRVSEFVCSAGPGDRAFEERHDGFSIAAVVAGTFRYRAGHGTGLLHPGALLLGNHEACFECGHEHSRGDRCIAVKIEPELFAEIAAGVAGSGRFRFPTAMLPASARSMPWVARLQAGGAAGAPPLGDETVIGLAERVVAALAESRPAPARLAARDERRISRVLHHLADAAADAVDLDRLAALAGMSKYHFLRTFRRVVGRTPYQYLLDLRLRTAAVRLATTAEPVATIAFDAGFGDLSTFNQRFRRQFGASPRAYRSGRRG